MTVPAVLGSARLGNFRLGYIPATLTAERTYRVVVTIDDVVVRYRVRTLIIHDDRNDNPNTAQFVVGADVWEGSPLGPNVGQTVRIIVNADDPTLLFTGTIQSLTDTYDLLPDQAAWLIRCQDDTPRANRRIPFAYFENESASAVAGALVRDFAPGFTAHHVEEGLPLVTILFDGSEAGMNGCLRALVKSMGGGYFYWENRDLHLFQTEATEQPDDLGTDGVLLDDPKILIEYDDSQLRTRVYGQGNGQNTTSPVSAGDVHIPLVDASLFAAAGGQAKIFEQILTYTSAVVGGDGSKVAGQTGLAPSACTDESDNNSNGNIPPGTHDYKVTFVINGGETEGGSTSDGATITSVSGMPGFSSLTASSGGSLTSSSTYHYVATYVTSAGETAPTGSFSTVILGGSDNRVEISGLGTSGDSRVTARRIYRANGTADGIWKRVTTINDNSTTSYTDDAADSSLTVQSPPSTNTSGSGRINLSNIPLGPSGTTARKLYRIQSGLGAAHRFLAQISDNTTTTYADNMSPSGLGQIVPTASTVPARVGDTTMAVQSDSPFYSGGSGGWAVVGSQLIRYTGASPNLLTGIPASGTGAIQAPIGVDSPVINSPMLRGVSGLVRDIDRGETVSVWVERNNTAAQAALAARDGSDGIIEHKIDDGRRNDESMTQLCDADLAQFAYPLITVTYATRDVKTKSGKPIRVNLPEFDIDETLTIQTVTITECEIAPGQIGPKFTAVASSVRFSLEDLLRRMSDTLGGR